MVIITVMLAACLPTEPETKSSSDDDDDKKTSFTKTGTISGDMIFTLSPGDTTGASSTYRVSVMTESDWAAYGGGDTSSYETAYGQGSFSTALDTNTKSFTISEVETGSYVILGFVWSGVDPATTSPNVIDYDAFVTGSPQRVTAEEDQTDTANLNLFYQ